MPSFADSIFLFVLALLLFGPKKLPVLAREIGKWMGEFRRASNEFKMQMEDELRASEQAERQKQIAAMEAAAPVPPPLGEPAEPEHPHLRSVAVDGAGFPVPAEAPLPQDAAPAASIGNSIVPPALADPTEAAGIANTAHHGMAPMRSEDPPLDPPLDLPSNLPSAEAALPETASVAPPLPIAVSGSLKMMPPPTGLPTPRSSRPNALSGLVDAIPEVSSNGSLPSAAAAEGVVHGD